MPAADRRQAILAAALDVFADQGFAEASLEDVAARDGISKALIYEHFPSKGELVDELVATYGGGLLAEVVEATSKASPGEERLRVGVEAFFAFVGELPAGWRLITRNATHPDVAAGFRELHDVAAANVAAMVASDLPPERSRDPDFATACAALAHQIVGSTEALATWWIDHPDVPRDRVVALAMDFAWVGLERLAAGERWSA
jgi:AcrR family transcriptional regulator